MAYRPRCSATYHDEKGGNKWQRFWRREGWVERSSISAAVRAQRPPRPRALYSSCTLLPKSDRHILHTGDGMRWRRLPDMEYSSVDEPREAKPNKPFLHQLHLVRFQSSTADEHTINRYTIKHSGNAQRTSESDVRVGTISHSLAVDVTSKRDRFDEFCRFADLAPCASACSSLSSAALKRC
jgi:hypothetical protein